MSRDDLLLANYRGYQEKQPPFCRVAKYSPDSIIIVVTIRSTPWRRRVPDLEFQQEPRSSACGHYWIARVSAPSSHRNSTSGGERDRVVMGARRHHGAFGPLEQRGGNPADGLMDQATIDRIVTRTANGGAEIVKYSRPEVHIMHLRPRRRVAESILKDKKKVCPAPRIWKASTVSKDFSSAFP